MGSRCSEKRAELRSGSEVECAKNTDLCRSRSRRSRREAVPNGGQPTFRLRPYDFRVSPRQRPVRVGDISRIRLRGIRLRRLSRIRLSWIRLRLRFSASRRRADIKRLAHRARIPLHHHRGRPPLHRLRVRRERQIVLARRHPAGHHRRRLRRRLAGHRYALAVARYRHRQFFRRGPADRAPRRAARKIEMKSKPHSNFFTRAG